MEPRRGRSPRVSLHSLPPFDSHCPLPAIGYLKGYLEKHRPGISVTCAHWHQALWKLLRPWVDERMMRGVPESYEEFFDAVFARLYLLESEEPADAGDIGFLEKHGSIFLNAQPLESFVALCDRIGSFLRDEMQRLDLDTMDIVGASVMHRQLIPALAFLRYARRRLRTPLTILGGFPTAEDACQIMTAFPFVDIGVFGDGEQTLLEICDAWQDPGVLEGLPGTVVRRGERVIENPGRGYVHAPEMAFANYDGFDWTERGEGPLLLPICNSRGCAWGKCAFCIVNSRPPEHFSARTPQSILAEVRQHLTSIRKSSQAPIKVTFLGTEIVGCAEGPGVLVELLRGLVELRAQFGNLSIHGDLSPLGITDEIARLLNALHATVQFGFEQWSRVVELARKRHRIIDALHALKLFEPYPNLHIVGFNLIVGFPGENLMDVYETKSNLWRLKYLLARLLARHGSRRAEQVYVNVRTLRMMQVPIRPRIARGWDFQNPFIRENAAHRPCTVLLGMMCGDEALAADYVGRNQYFEAYDTTATAGLQRRLVARLEALLEECSIQACRNTDGLLELVLFDGRNRLAVPLEDCLLRILHETRDIMSQAQLAERLADVPADEVKEGIEFLDTAELLYVSRGDGRLINTLPAHIQAEVDVVALRQQRENVNGSDRSGAEQPAPGVWAISSDGAAGDAGLAGCR
jgi:radical SAM superfamily enzyme YgiQ (UPF0313 family)